MRCFVTVPFALIAILSIGVVCQNRPALPKCNLDLSKAPELRGFYLGQSYVDVGERLPGFIDDYEAADQGYFGNEKANYRILHLYSLKRYRPIIDQTDFEDVTITWHFYDGTLVRLFVTYSDFRPKSLRDFINQVASTTGMPGASFRTIDKHRAKLACIDFSLEVNEGEYTKVGWSPYGSSLVLEDTVVIARLEKELAERKAAERREAARKKAEELKKRSTLRP